jgi:SAM-dependent methyltransferase
MALVGDRLPHAVQDLPSRRAKGLKIERLLDLSSRGGKIRMLEVGTGTGGIAHYFATHATLDCTVDAVDVVDGRRVSDGYRFHLVHGTTLPFADGSFDVVLSNHVIEHVGEHAEQLAHLRELRRVMAPGGVGYLAVPNRWMLVEPHYRLAFLSCLPRRLRTRYLRLWRKGEFYDCEPLEMRQLERFLASSGLTGRNLCIEAWRATLDIERPARFGTRLFSMVPDTLVRPLRPIIPTLIYRVVTKDDKNGQVRSQDVVATDRTTS